MAEIQNKFTSDDKEINRSLENMQKQMAKLREEAAKANEESKHHHNELIKVAGEAREQLMGLVPQFYTVEGTVEIVKQAYEKWHEKIAEATATHRDFTSSVIRDLARIGEAYKADEIAEGLKGITGATAPQAEQIFRAASSAIPPGPNTLERALSITQQIAPAQSVIDAQLAARISGSAQSAFGDRVDAANFGVRAMQAAGGAAPQLPDLFGRIQQLVSAGMSPEQATGLAIEDLRQNQSPKALTSLAEAIGKDVKAIKPQPAPKGANTKFSHPQRFEPLSPTDQAVNRYAATTDRSERLQLLLNDPLVRRGVLGDTSALAIEQFNLKAARDTGAGLSRPGAVDELLHEVRSSGIGSRVLAGAEGEARREEAFDKLRQFNNTKSIIGKELEAYGAERGYGPVGSYLSGLMYNVGYFGARASGLGFVDRDMAARDALLFSLPRQEANKVYRRAQQQFAPDWEPTFREEARAAGGRSYSTPAATGQQPLAAALERNTRAMEANTKAMEGEQADRPAGAQKVFVPLGRHEEPR